MTGEEEKEEEALNGKGEGRERACREDRKRGGEERRHHTKLTVINYIAIIHSVIKHGYIHECSCVYHYAF